MTCKANFVPTVKEIMPRQAMLHTCLWTYICYSLC